VSDRLKLNNIVLIIYYVEPLLYLS
jgi:hypothetical protein